MPVTNRPGDIAVPADHLPPPDTLDDVDSQLPARRRTRRPRPTPSYRFGHPHWGLPALSANPYPPGRSVPPLPRQSLRVCGVLAVVTAAAALAAAAAEGWRYQLLLAGRTRILDAATVAASDMLLAATSYLSLGAGLAALITGLLALGRLRPDQLIRLVVPLWNLVTIPQTLAEVEAERTGRTEPSRLARSWQWCWLLSGLLAVTLTIARQWASTPQRQANLVLGHLFLDVLAAIVGLLTAVMVVRLAGGLSAPRRRVVLSGPASPVP